MKNPLFHCLLMAGCQPKSKQQATDQQASVTINSREYTNSVSVDSVGNHVRIKPGAGRVKAKVSGSGNTVEIK